MWRQEKCRCRTRRPVKRASYRVPYIGSRKHLPSFQAARRHLAWKSLGLLYRLGKSCSGSFDYWHMSGAALHASLVLCVTTVGKPALAMLMPTRFRFGWHRGSSSVGGVAAEIDHANEWRQLFYNAIFLYVIGHQYIRK